MKPGQAEDLSSFGLFRPDMRPADQMHGDPYRAVYPYLRIAVHPVSSAEPFRRIGYG